MKQVAMAIAKARLSELLTAVEKGETIEITRRGQIVARLVPADTVKKPIDYARLRRHLASLPFQDETAGDFVRKMREEERY